MSASASDSLPKPLSAYNLFYRYKRIKIIQASSGGKDGGGDGSNSSGCATKKDMCNLIESPAGLEDYAPAVRSMLPQDRVLEIRGNNILVGLDGQFFSKDKRSRVHRKSGHGYKMSFVEMNKVMVGAWKSADDFAKSFFRDLAVEARREYERRVTAMNAERYLTMLSGMQKRPNPGLEDGPALKQQRLLACPAPAEQVFSLPSAAATTSFIPSFASIPTSSGINAGFWQPPQQQKVPTFSPSLDLVNNNNPSSGMNAGIQRQQNSPATSQSQLNEAFRRVSATTDLLTNNPSDGVTSQAPSPAEPSLPQLVEKIYQPKPKASSRPAVPQEPANAAPTPCAHVLVTPAGGPLASAPCPLLLDAILPLPFAAKATGADTTGSAETRASSDTNGPRFRRRNLYTPNEAGDGEAGGESVGDFDLLAPFAEFAPGPSVQVETAAVPTSNDSGAENGRLTADKHNVSVEDFMELFATLDESL